MKKLILIISLCLLLSGCYDYRELNELAIVNAISIDIEDNDRAYIVSLLEAAGLVVVIKDMEN